MITPEIVVASARKLVGLPYGHQGRVRPDGRGGFAGPAVDCAGLLIFVGRDTGASEFDVLGYSPDPDGETFERALDGNLVRLDDKFAALPGDVLAFDYGKGVQHVAVVTGIEPGRRDWRRYRVAHAVREPGRVVDAAMGWKLAKFFVAAYRLPELCA